MALMTVNDDDTEDPRSKPRWSAGKKLDLVLRLLPGQPGSWATALPVSPVSTSTADDLADEVADEKERCLRRRDGKPAVFCPCRGKAPVQGAPGRRRRETVLDPQLAVFGEEGRAETRDRRNGARSCRSTASRPGANGYGWRPLRASRADWRSAPAGTSTSGPNTPADRQPSTWGAR
jgi:hypothetical protein